MWYAYLLFVLDRWAGRVLLRLRLYHLKLRTAAVAIQRRVRGVRDRAAVRLLRWHRGIMIYLVTYPSTFVYFSYVSVCMYCSSNTDLVDLISQHPIRTQLFHIY